MYLFGTILLVAATALALLAAGSYAMVARGRNAALLYGRLSSYAMLTAVLSAWFLLIALFLARRYDIAYVNNYSSNDLSIFFTVAATWAGQPGSFLIWIVWTAIAATLLIRRSRHFEPYVMAVLMVILAGLMVFTIMLNPFSPLTDPNTGQALTPNDGRGLNPTLHNFWMIIHPPILFWGYALATVPFAFAIAALLRRDYDTWVKRAMPWTLAAWTLLGLALLLGGYWAYETLGWGGYWGWDPVENSSLVPWILLTALLHGMLVQRTHGGLRRTNLLLALMTYFMVFYATFLTRSGAYANFSVHSFVAEGIYEALVGFMLALYTIGLGLFFWRWRDIPKRALSEKFFSRDSFFVLAILSLVMIALVIGLGTSMPVVSAIPGVGHALQDTFARFTEIDQGGSIPGTQEFTDGRFSLTQAFYQRTTPPLGLVVVVLLIIGPLLGWRDGNMRHLLHTLRWPAAAAVVAAIVAMLIDVRGLLALAYVTLTVFAFGTNLVMLIRTLRGGFLRIGGYLAHLGFALLVIGVVGSSAYATPEERLSLAPGETVSLYGFDFTFNGYKVTPQNEGVIDLTVNHNGDTFNAQPHLYPNEKMGMMMTFPAIKSYLWQDLYVSPAEYMPETNPNKPVLTTDDTITAGPYQITFTGFYVDQEKMLKGEEAPEVGAKLKVVYEGKETDMTAMMKLVADQASAEQTFQPTPLELPGGHTLRFTNLVLEQRLAFLEIDGINAEVQPARAVVTVSTKPLVLLVWVGVVVAVLGGLLALVRRYLENQAKLAGQPVRLPAFSRKPKTQPASPQPATGD
ncbi:MAG: cytochrome c biogenesis protein CcsA [Chloroflexaceae bacterium]|jgi:cytochrome c-type biogenesis protein CcmF|nr:cytochrome c biogenesis protein CcsA [Chloroflexaceae bacterium]